MSDTDQITVAVLIANDKVYGMVGFKSALLAQTVPMAQCRLLLVVEDGQYLASTTAEALVNEFTSCMASAEILIVPSLSPDSYCTNLIRSGKKALLRQAALTRYLASETPGPLIFWNADIEWGANFLAECLASPAPVFAAPYVVRGAITPMLLKMQGGVAWHCTPEESASRETFEYIGGGGLGAPRAVWEFFQREYDGFNSYARYPDGTPTEVGYGEERHLLACLGVEALLLRNVSGWHNDGEGVAVRLAWTEAGWEHHLRGFGREINLGDRTVRRNAALTVAVAVHDSKIPSLDTLTRSLTGQDHDLSSVRLLLAVQNPSPVSEAHLAAWMKTDDARRFASVDLWAHDVPPLGPGLDPENEPQVVKWKLRAARIQLLDRYLSLPADDGLVWWDADQDWDCDLLSRLAGCGWPVATGMACHRGSDVPLHFAVGREWFSTPAEAGEAAVCRYNGMGGFFMERDLCEKFVGWKDYIPNALLTMKYCGEDFYLQVCLEPPALLVKDVRCRHRDAKGLDWSLETDAQGIWTAVRRPWIKEGPKWLNS